MGRRKKTVGSSEALPGLADIDHVHGDLGPPNSCNNRNGHLNESSCPASSVQTISVQNPEVTDEDGEVDGDDDEENGDETTMAADFASERQKLDDGFFEIEAVRRKRVRKGQLQYLVKWQGWPETANTWEPLENLQSCSEFVDAFEESVQSGKQRKRKFKQGAINTHLKKRKHCHNFDTDNVTDVEISVLNNKIPSDLPIPQLPVVSFCEGEFYSSSDHIKTTGTIHLENESMNRETDGRRKRDEYDPKLSELKETVSANMVDCTVYSAVDSDQRSQCTGAKRRKSSAVKRFTKEAAFSEDSEQGLEQNAAAVSIEPGDQTEELGHESSMLSGHSRNVPDITRIIKPISYSVSVSNNIQDVLVTFLVMRSDGKEVIVNNKFLKDNHPLLLINFYEQHLRCNLTS